MAYGQGDELPSSRLVGASSGLGIADILALVGRDEFALRVAAAQEKLSKKE